MADQPAAEIARFEETGDPAALRRAADLLEQMDLRAAEDLAGRRELRRSALDAWVRLLNLIDEKLDPEFDPDDLPELSVQPPAEHGVQFPPGIDTAAITDPVAARAYEKAMEENRRKAQVYNLQHLLRRLEAKASAAIEDLVKEAYLPIPYDQQELESTLKALRKPERRTTLQHLAPG